MVPTGVAANDNGKPWGKREQIAMVVRDVVEGDARFIDDSYLNSFRRQKPMSWVRHDLYFRPQRAILTQILGRSRVLVACFPEDPNEILGYAIYEYMNDALVLHYIYAKLGGHGIRQRLLRAAAGGLQMVAVTHAIPDFWQLVKKAAPMTVVYDPYLLPRLMAHG